jgi:RNA polymerase sigma factor (sigma-70 family)
VSDASNTAASADTAPEDRTDVRDPLKDQFVNVWGPVILKVARSRFGFQEADAADIVQETCLLAISKRGTTLPPDLEGLSRWIASAAWKLCWGAVRKQRRVSALTDVELDTLSGRPPPDVVVAAERAALVHLAMAALPKRYALLLRLLFFAPSQPDYETIARELGIKPGSVGGLRKRALLRFEKELGRLGFDA